MKFVNYIATSILSVLLLFSSCGNGFLDVEYTKELDEYAASNAAGKNPDVFLNGMWQWMVTKNQTNAATTNMDDFGLMAILHATDMMCEDIALSRTGSFTYDYRLENRYYNYRRPRANWICLYTNIANANQIITLYPNGGVTVNEKGLLGQALTLRAYSYYYLIQLFQHPVTEYGTINSSAYGVPLIYTEADGKTSEEITASKSRNTLEEVYAQIESDLLRAVTALEAGYIRPNKNYIDISVAYGVLARYYLLSQQWSKAIEFAQKAQQGYKIMDNKDLHDGFYSLSNSEWMWGFENTTSMGVASFFSHISNFAPGYSGLGNAPRLIDRRLYDAIPEDDYRKTLFNGPNGNPEGKQPGAKIAYANLKFGSDGNWTMDYMYMRASEMILIEAEAYVHNRNYTEAASALRKLMVKRQPSWDKTTVTLDDVLLQRRIELWGEGFAYFDLKRLNKGIDRDYEGSNHLAGYKKVVPALDVAWIYQIPTEEMQENPLIKEEHQNP